jgi:hypothetical protein
MPALWAAIDADAACSRDRFCAALAPTFCSGCLQRHMRAAVEALSVKYGTA